MIMGVFQFLYLVAYSFAFEMFSGSDLFTEYADTQDALCPSQESACQHDTTNPIKAIKYCCGRCECHQDCFKHGSCCLKQYSNFETGEKALKDSRYECVRPQFVSTNQTQNNLYRMDYASDAWMIARCNSSTVDKISQSLCETPGEDGFLDSVIPVTDKLNHYKNRYCALCNGIEETEKLIRWGIVMECSIPLTYMTPLTMIEDENCTVVFTFPRSHGHKMPDSCRKNAYEISTCNVTGLWPFYNRTTEMACNSYVDPFNFTYKNYFCYVCNTDTPLPHNTWNCTYEWIKNSITKDITPSFVMLVDPDREYTEAIARETLDCDNHTQFADAKMMKCRDILCNTNRVLWNAKCERLINADDNRCYLMFIKLTPLQNSSLPSYLIQARNYQDSLQKAMVEVFREVSDNITEFILYYKISVDGDFTVEYLLVQISVNLVDVSLSTDFFSTIVARVHKRSLVIDEVNLSFISHLVTLELSIIGDTNSIQVPNQKGDSFDSLERVNLHENKVAQTKLIPCNKTVSVLFDMILICPFITLNYRELSMQIVNTVLFIDGTLSKPIFRWEYRPLNDTILLCLSTYKQIYDRMAFLQVEVTNITSDPKRLLSFFCVSLSILSLLITISIYLKLSELHSQPGVNTIILCTALLLAQTLYQFGAGQRSLSVWACSLIGAICHFLWLSVMFAMNVCSIDMFLVFRKLSLTKNKFSWKCTLYRVGYISLLSLSFVAVNIIVSITVSSGESIGYGGSVCYLSSFLMHIITFILPSFATILINFVLFFYVVFKIGKTTINSEHRHLERNYFAIYIRLSVLTGITWLFGFLQLLVQTEILEYLFIVLNAGQGVYIMVAFIVKKSVFNHFCHQKQFNRTVSQETKVACSTS